MFARLLSYYYLFIFMLHKNNIHHGRYDLQALCKTVPALSAFIINKPNGELTLNFADAKAVKLLNKALLMHHYRIRYWDIPDGFLCPPIPSRADYIHHLAEFLHSKVRDKGQPVHALDIGTGANCIYPIIGHQCYQWHFTATDIQLPSVNNAQKICDKNQLSHAITVKHQTDARYIFKNIITPDARFDITLCNPPFHASLADAMAANANKKSKLAKNKQKRQSYLQQQTSSTKEALNFGGQQSELWCKGGEITFLKQYIQESKEFGHQVDWFSSLVSKAENLFPLTKKLKQLSARHISEINMRHGQKVTRVLVWSWRFE